MRWDGPWTQKFGDPAELRAAFGAAPGARFRPVPIWWWSGEPLDEERLLWQLERMAELGVGGWAVTGLALHAPAVGSRADEPLGFTPEWLKLYRLACERSKQLGLGVVAWSPLQLGGPHEANEILAARPHLRGELVGADGEVTGFGLDYNNPDAIAAMVAPGSTAGNFLHAVDDLLGDVIVGMFEDEFALFPAWSPTFAEDFRELKGYDFPVDAIHHDVGRRTPALRWDLYDVAATRAERSYTAHLDSWVRGNGLLAGYDQMNRYGDPLISSFAYFDPFRTMAWASAPGTDQMGDARFAMSLADLSGAPRVWLEGFHSHGWGMPLSHQMRLLFEWVREGISLFMPHGFYYATRALWWEWAPPEMGWRQPYARHYPVFAEAVGRLMMAMSAGEHQPEVAVLYPTSTVWAGTVGLREWSEEAQEASAVYTELFGVHDTPSSWEPERARIPSLLAEAGYDRVAIDEAHVGDLDVPILLPSCRCLRTDTLRTLVEQAESGRLVVVVGALPVWSAEKGRDDKEFLALAERLKAAATVVSEPAEAVAALPPSRAQGLKAQWRRVGDLDVVLVTGTGAVRLRDMANRAPQRWDIRTGSIEPFPATIDGDDLLVTLDEPATLLSLPVGIAVAPESVDYEEVALPEAWSCEYLPWGENRWGDYILPPNEGNPPVERRTFAFREGDDPEWRRAPVTPEDVEQPFTDVGFEQHMYGVTGRPAPSERLLPGGWREVVPTYGPKAVVDGEPAEYSERLGIEDLALSTHIGLKGWVEPVKVDLGADGRGQVVSYGHVDSACETHLVVECSGVVAVMLDGEQLLGPTEGGILAIPVRLAAGWHELVLDAAPRAVATGPLSEYLPTPRTRLAWVFAEPYGRDPISVWGGAMLHPDYKGSAGPRAFRRRIVLPQRAQVAVRMEGSGPLTCDAPPVLDPGEHVVTCTAVGGDGSSSFMCSIELTMPSGVLTIDTNGLWETSAPGGSWEGVFPLGSGHAPRPEWPVQRRRGHALTDVAWLQGDEVIAGQVSQRWSDSPEAPPPAWFCFTAPPGARSMTLPIEGDVQAWLDGEPLAVEGDRISLREGGRVAIRVQAPAGFRGAACFRHNPRVELGSGTIKAGTSWHRQGLDSFSGVIVCQAEVEAPRGGPAILDLGEVAGSVAASVNGERVGVLAWEPWRLPVTLRAGRNVIELEVANTLGPMAARGVPTPFGPEDQRVSGLLARPRLLL